MQSWQESAYANTAVHALLLQLASQSSAAVSFPIYMHSTSEELLDLLCQCTVVLDDVGQAISRAQACAVYMPVFSNFVRLQLQSNDWTRDYSQFCIELRLVIEKTFK